MMSAESSSQPSLETIARRPSRYVMLLPAATLVVATYVAVSWAHVSNVHGAALLLVPIFMSAWTVGRAGAFAMAGAGVLALLLATQGTDFSAIPSNVWIRNAFDLVTLLCFGEVVHRLRNQRDLYRQTQAALLRTRAAKNELETHDPVSKLLKERNIRTRLTDEVLRSTRYGHPVSLIYIDIDHSNALLQREGDRGMQRAVSNVGRLILDVSRTSDVAGRISEDEFAVILIETGYGAAAVVAERLRAAMISDRTLLDLGVTASFGVVSWPDADNPTTSLTGEALLEAAIQAMNLAKEQGGDRIVASTH